MSVLAVYISNHCLWLTSILDFLLSHGIASASCLFFLALLLFLIFQNLLLQGSNYEQDVIMIYTGITDIILALYHLTLPFQNSTSGMWVPKRLISRPQEKFLCLTYLTCFVYVSWPHNTYFLHFSKTCIAFVNRP